MHLQIHNISSLPADYSVRRNHDDLAAALIASPSLHYRISCEQPIRWLISLIVSVACCIIGVNVGFAQTPLEATLSTRPLSNLAQKARILGDASRGARVFNRSGLSCVQCHAPTPQARQLGPDLALLENRGSYEHVIDSILRPSLVLLEGYQTQKILTVDGEVLTGMIRNSTPESLTLSIPGEEQLREIPTAEIDTQIAAPSMMPAGLVNQLQDENEFYDLVRFIVELGAVGPQRAHQLLVASTQSVAQPLPAYESDLDHAGMLQAWNQDSFERGEKLYGSLCVNCHGTQQQPGSLPNALRFASGKFSNGSDPLSIYRTLTHGYRMMLAQRQLVPQQKYDVIHYIREAFIKTNNRSQFFEVNPEYLASLPKGTKRGPTPKLETPWSDMDYGPFLISTYEMSADQPAQRSANSPTQIAYKGIAVRLDAGAGGIARGSHWLAFEHDTLRVAGAWSGTGFIDWQGVLFDGKHNIHPRTEGTTHFSLPNVPGWANPATGSFEDPRVLGRDGLRYGPLPREWAHYRGLYRHGQRVVVSYTVGDASVLESHRIHIPAPEQGDSVTWVRVLNVGQSSHDLTLRVAPVAGVQIRVHGLSQNHLTSDADYTLLKIPAEETPVNLELHLTADSAALANSPSVVITPEDLQPLTLPGPAQWTEVQEVNLQPDATAGAFVVDTLPRPAATPWHNRLRLTGIDFLPEDRMLVCTWDGDVWMVSNIHAQEGSLGWKRVATGLFHPLGIKVLNGKIHVTCRDQIVILHDLNGDDETDYYENFNSDHQVTEHFHEFAMGLQADEEGNLYYAKSARHAKDSLVPHHGTLLRVSSDGHTTTILANGFRAANGVCLNPDGSYFVTDQEGHWNPMNRINRVVEGGFYGNMYSYGAPDDSRDEAMEPPLCWPNKSFDRSPAELLWLDHSRWGPLQGSLINMSYGYGRLYIVPHEHFDDVWQGGMSPLPIADFPTGLVRGRVHPESGQLFVCGLSAWATSQTESTGGLYRIRPSGKAMHLPIGLTTQATGITLTFTEPVDRRRASDPNNFLIETWKLKRTKNYGSDQYDRHALQVSSASVSEDGRSVELTVENIAPTWCMEIAYELADTEGELFQGIIQNTIHQLGTEP
ncbi:DUF6797 domain-containing protein [Aureliella helgolandensis]|uniref:Cytochrome c n=1 Tax=Aureliella helgolandensis TaxID=2527968 RepID=A0A518GA58_9BACT|nr:DUF6797 domain-containing protein [Aureliella helgolandensis]QDV25477.1 Cytochrome c [Aureliella helgolandensis]